MNTASYFQIVHHAEYLAALTNAVKTPYPFLLARARTTDKTDPLREDRDSVCACSRDRVPTQLECQGILNCLEFQGIFKFVREIIVRGNNNNSINIS